ncbi:pentatricopeptide repeat-containing protein at1g71210 [Phtheirospermum japonicum]|uniref:Pentatricopeptide repeat-containing protein at1g71210 n=1 Tax=Phtheirospermum japonicum TaxID=374723 RepID=A0A830B4J9_9LAMI|nr:pentatricopeptide repeat-containing protein at1g71210 [Phtheirospermum japonicum]
MQTLRYARQTRALLCPPPAAAAAAANNTTAALLFVTSLTPNSYPFSSSYPLSPSSSDLVPSNGSQSEIHPKEAGYYFREWFMSRKKPIFDRIFEILRTQDESVADSALSRLNLGLSETLILDVLNYEKKDVLSCLKFFDWAGRQKGFHHTRATFNAIFRIISRAKLMSLMLDFLQNYMKQRYVHKIRYYNVLVIGYAVAGKPEIALEVFGKMRFMGVDLDGLAYHVLLNSLVEQGYFDVVETVAREIRNRGFQNEITHSIMMKSLCKQNELGRGEEYLRGLVQDDDGKQLSDPAVGIFVEALCKDNQFERAALLVEEFQRMGLISMDHAYGVWIRDLVKAGKLDNALGFLKDKQAVEGYVPDIFRYNTLICRLLRENRMEEVYDMLADMKEKEILPDNVTMNATLCFLCKAGRMDIALDLYDSRAEFGLSVNYMAYNYLINTLLGDASVNDAYRVLKNSIEQGYIPGQKTFSIIADALCRDGRLDKMKELVLFTLDQKVMPNNLTYDKFISDLCRSGQVEEGYLVHGLTNTLNKTSRRSTYMSLISGFSKSRRGGIAARLLIEMQEKGYTPNRILLREVICCLCKGENSENQFFGLLEMQLARKQLSTSTVYNFFIDGAGYAKRPDLARQAYEMMRRSGIEPDSNSNILMLQSYLKSGRIAHALNLFHDLSMKWHNRKLWHTMITGLCKAEKPEYASQVLDDMKANKLIPSIECHEELIKVYCDMGQYYKALDLVNDMTQVGRPISSFIGNIFLLHALRTRKVYRAWAYLTHTRNPSQACWALGHVVGVFSGSVEGNYDYEELEKLIQQCFHIDIYTNNMLLRKLSMKGVGNARKFLEKLSERGYEPNRWTYDIIVHGLAKDGRTEEARMWMNEMFHKGFNLTEGTKKVLEAKHPCYSGYLFSIIAACPASTASQSWLYYGTGRFCFDARICCSSPSAGALTSKQLKYSNAVSKSILGFLINCMS